MPAPITSQPIQTPPFRDGPVLRLESPHFHRTVRQTRTDGGSVTFAVGSATSPVLQDMLAVAKSQLAEDEMALCVTPIGHYVPASASAGGPQAGEYAAHYIAGRMVNYGELPPGDVAASYLATTPTAAPDDDAEANVQAACALAVQHRHEVLTDQARTEVAAEGDPSRATMITARGRDLASKLNPHIGTTTDIERIATVLAADAAAYNRIQERLCSDDLGEAGQADAEARADHLQTQMVEAASRLPMPDAGRWGIHFSGDPRGHTVRLLPPGTTPTDGYIGLD